MNVAAATLEAVRTARVLRFGDTEIDVARREIRRLGALVDVQPQVFDLIVHLARHRDRVVGREELLDEVWGTRFVAASTLTGRIRTARRVLGDTGDEQLVIRTVHGRGYRFVADVHEADVDHRDVEHGAGDHRTDDAPARAWAVPTGDTHERTTDLAPATASGRGRPVAFEHEWPFVGRADVIDDVTGWYVDRSIGGVILEGVDGVGTTRTATAVAERLSGRGARVITVRGLGGGVDLPLSALSPLVDISVLETSHAAPGLALADIMQKAVTKIRSIDDGDDPLVLVVDDVHHVDALSMAVINSLVSCGAVFVVVAARHTAVGRGALDPLVQSGMVRTVTIEPLSMIHLDVLLYRALRGPIDGDSLRAFAAASGGRPGHLRELTTAARAGGSLRFESGVWRLTGPISPRAVLEWPRPTLTRAAIEDAEVIAIAGEISIAHLDGLCDDDALDELDRHQLLTVTGACAEPLVSLADPALAALVVDSIGPLRRRRLRRNIAERLMMSAPDDACALATVLDCIDQDDVAVEIDEAHACDVARRAFEEGRIGQALRLVDRMTSWDLPDAVVLRAEAAAHRSQWELADSLLADTAIEALQPSWHTAAVTLGADLDFFQHARHEHAIDVLARHAEARTGEVERAVDRHLWLLAERGDANGLAEHLPDVVDRSPRTPERTLALAVAALMAGRFSEALALTEEFTRLTGERAAARLVDAALSVRCLALRELGRLDEARDISRHALGLGGSHGLGVLPIVGSLLELESGLPRAARVLLGSLADSGHVRRHPHLTPIVTAAAGAVEFRLGHVDAALELFGLAERDLDRTPTRIAWLARIAMAEALVGHDGDAARRQAGRVVDEARRLGAATPEAHGLTVLVATSPSTWGEVDVTARLAELAGGFEGPRWASMTRGLLADRHTDARESCTSSP